MKSYLSLIPISASVQKKKNTMTILCIILSVFLVTAIFSMADMELRSQKIRAISNYGNWHICLKSISREDAALIAARPDVAASSWYEVLNYRLDEDYSIDGRRAAICGVEEELVTNIMQGGITEGKYPEENQVILTQSAKEYMGIHIGDTIVLKIPSGDMIPYTVSGFGMDTMMTAKMDALGVFMPVESFRELYQSAQGKKPADDDLVYYVQFQPRDNIKSSIADIKAQYHLSADDIGENTALLGVMGFSSDSYMMGLYVVAAVLFALVLTAGILMIASSMNSSVAQRMVFFGMLRCIGAEPKQIMRLVRLEALNWCKIAIPAGVAAGVAVTWGLCAVLRVLSAHFFSDLPAFGVSIPGIAAGMMVGLLTVLLAARTPAKKAAGVSPLMAVSGDTQRAWKVKNAAGTKVFKVDVALGIYHAKQSRKNFILMMGSFAISIVLFLSFSPLIDFMNYALTPLKPYTPDLSISSSDGSASINQGLLQELSQKNGVKRVYGRMAAEEIPGQIGSEQKNITLISYDAQQFDWVMQEKWVSDRDGLKNVIEDQDRGDVLALYQPGSSLKEGDRIVSELGELTVAGILEQSPFHAGPDSEILICSEKLFTKLTGETDYSVIDIQLTKDADEENIKAIRALAEEMVFSDRRLSNQETRGAYYSFVLFVYGFLAVIAMITVFHIVNSISMSVSARRKQYGAMRAVGMGVDQMIRMIGAETLTYALTGIVVGCAVGLPLHRILWNYLIYTRWGESWKIPGTAAAVIIGFTAAACLIAVYGPAKRIGKMAVVDIMSDHLY